LSISDGGKVIKYSRCGSATVTNASSQEIANKEVLFSCKTKKDKLINLTKSGNKIEYSFGYPNKKPELVIDSTLEKSYPNLGARGDLVVSLTKGKYTYDVGYMRPAFEDEGNTLYGEFWGVIVTDTKSYKEIVKVKCTNPEMPSTEALLKLSNSLSE